MDRDRGERGAADIDIIVEKRSEKRFISGTGIINLHFFTVQYV